METGFSSAKDSPCPGERLICLPILAHIACAEPSPVRAGVTRSVHPHEMFLHNLHIETWPIDNVKPFQRNPRDKHLFPQVQRFAAR